jgi:hypothetical protein
MWRVGLIFAVACGTNDMYSGGGSGSAAMPPIGKTTEPANDRCAVDTDCVIGFPPTDVCCPNSGAPLAMTRDHEAKLVPPPDKRCSEDTVASCAPRLARRLWPDPVCKNQTCVATPHVTPVFDVTAFSRACSVDADCTLVEREPCIPCRCTSYGIAAKERGRYLEAFGAFKDKGCKDRFAVSIAIMPCVHCDEVISVCNHGICDARSIEPVPVGGECASDSDCVISCARTDACCEIGPCEDVIARSKLAELIAQQPTKCQAVRCPAPEPPSYITPRCKVGKCFGEVQPRR